MKSIEKWCVVISAILGVTWWGIIEGFPNDVGPLVGVFIAFFFCASIAFAAFAAVVVIVAICEVTGLRRVVNWLNRDDR